MNEFGLSEKTMEIIHEIYSQFPQIESVILYGSRAKGNFKPGSDIDMTIVADPTFDFSALAKVNTMFHESSLPYLYDISDFSKLTNPDLIEHIKRCGKVIYRNDNRIRLPSRGRSLCDSAGVPQRVAN